MANPPGKQIALRERTNARRALRWLRAWCAIAALPVACTSILSIDGNYIQGSSGNGGSGDRDVGSPEAAPPETGGMNGTGGASESGGTVESGGNASGGQVAANGGAPGTGGAIPDCTENPCDPGFKCCGSQTSTTKACYEPAPLVGCGDTGCDFCANPVPDNATLACVAKKCSFTCDPGYTLDTKSEACVATGTGGAGTGGAGAGGTNGTGGATAPCTSDKQCPKGCGPAGLFGCCLPNGVCGCTFFNYAIGGSMSIGYCLPRPGNFPVP